MLAATTNVTQYITIGILAVGFVGGLVAAVIVFSRTKAMGDNVDVFSKANDELRKVNADQQHEYDTKIEHLTEAMHISERKCAAEIEQLKGQVQLLIGDLGTRIAEAAVDAVTKRRDEHG